MTVGTQAERTQPGAAAHTHGPGVPERSRGERTTSFVVADFPVPTGREEDWRFTPMDRLVELHTGAPAQGPRPAWHVEAGSGIEVTTVSREDSRLGVTGAPGDRVAAQAWSAFPEALVVAVTGAPSDEGVPAHAHLTLTGQGGTAYGHTLVTSAAGSRAVVVLDHQGSGAWADNVEFDVADGADLTVISVQDWARDAVHLSAHRARLGQDSHLKHVVVTLGGDLVRITPSAGFTAPGGDVELLGLYLVGRGQHQEHRLFVDHAQPRCRSNVVYKGALEGEGAHSVWVGDVLIRAVAQGTDTYEVNRNLVLGDGARADSVPNLEIETGEIIGAGHASATGRFDDEQLFYLQSRGVPADEARRLVVRGFFAQLVQQLGLPELQDRLLATIDARLAAGGEVH